MNFIDYALLFYTNLSDLLSVSVRYYLLTRGEILDPVKRVGVLLSTARTPPELAKFAMSFVLLQLNKICLTHSLFYSYISLITHLPFPRVHVLLLAEGIRLYNGMLRA